MVAYQKCLTMSLTVNSKLDGYVTLLLIYFQVGILTAP